MGLDKLLGFLRCFSCRPSKFSGKRVLVVDDGELERKFISRTLEKRGFVVATAASGQEALAVIEQQEGFDLVLLDFYMPGQTGKDLCAHLKTLPKTKDIPVIFLTGSATDRNVVECFDVGAEYFLRKPISGGVLLRHVDMILNELAEYPRGK